MAGLYIHIPFCGQLCTYCDFHFSVSLSRMDDMIDALKKEVSARKDYLKKKKIKTLYLGGGTPSLLSASQLEDIISHAAHEFDFSASELEEVTMECNPEDLTRDYLKSLKKLGVSRLSIGIQSFDDNILKTMNRRHNGEKAQIAVYEAREAGFSNISIDLIFGIPESSDNIVAKDLQKALELSTEHISVYHLTIENKTVLGWKQRKGEFSAVSDEVSERQYRIIETNLMEAGFNHYEISNYAKEGFEAVHNSNYWNSTPYIGIGPSAHSYDGESRRWNIAGNLRYIDAINKNEPYFECETLSENDKYNEYVMTSLRTSKGLNLNNLSEEMRNYFNRESRKLIKQGLLISENDRIFIKSSNFLLSDSIISDLYKI